MKYVKDGVNFLISMEKDDDVIESILSVVEEEKITSAVLSGIGALTDATLGFYNIRYKEYRKKNFPGNYELVSCQGNISEKDGKPFVHAHVSMSGPNYKTISGHLFSAKIAVVGEFILQPLETKIVRKMNDVVGLAAWSFPESNV